MDMSFGKKEFAAGAIYSRMSFSSVQVTGTVFPHLNYAFPS